MTTLSALYRSARSRLTDAGVDSAALDARLLVQQATGSSLDDIVCRPTQPVSPEAEAWLDEALQRRLAGEPVHRILGRREFFGLELKLSPETLEPRPDTEVLVELALAEGRRIVGTRGACRILDLGTGTGAIGLALANGLPEANVTLTDVSADALATARRNAETLGLAGRVATLASDWFDHVEGVFDLIVSNPPYIPSAEIGSLAREVRDFDPLRALDGGTDGLDAYRAIADGAARHLASDGAVAVEIGAGQKDDVLRLFGARNFRHDATGKDLSGHDRALLFAAR